MAHQPPLSSPGDMDLLGDWGQAEVEVAPPRPPAPAAPPPAASPRPVPSGPSPWARLLGTLGAAMSGGLGILVGLSMAWRDHVPDLYANVPVPAPAAVPGAGGDLIINVVPANAELYVGDQKVPGQTPFRLAALPVNVPQVVTIKAPGYDPLVRTVTPRTGESTLDLVLNPATAADAVPSPATSRKSTASRPTSAPIQEGGFLLIKTVPNSADVFVSGNKVGTTNAGKIMVSAGSVEVVLRDRTTMEAKAFTVKLAVGEQRTITYDFQEKAFVR